MIRTRDIPVITALFLIIGGLAHAQSFTIDWQTIDGGGVTTSSSGGFELGGTVSQADAGPVPPMIGGGFELVGGFWPVAQVCNCPGDLNGDGQRDGRDIQIFVQCVISGGACACADVDQVNGVDVNDVSAFAIDILAGTGCP